MAKKPTETIDAETGEVLTQAPPAETGPGGTGTAIATTDDTGRKLVTRGGMMFRVARQVTRAVLPMKVDPDSEAEAATLPDHLQVVCKIIETIYIGKPVQNSAIKQPAELAPIESTEGEERLLVVNAVLKKELDENYPDNSYVGRWFAITKHRKRPGKKYNNFSIMELEPAQ